MSLRLKYVRLWRVNSYLLIKRLYNFFVYPFKIKGILDKMHSLVHLESEWPDPNEVADRY
jgi:hypothetical protein